MGLQSQFFFWAGFGRSSPRTHPAPSWGVALAFGPFFFFFRGRKTQKNHKTTSNNECLDHLLSAAPDRARCQHHPARLGCTRADPGASSSFPSPPGGHRAASGHLLGAWQRLGRTDPVRRGWTSTAPRSGPDNHGARGCAGSRARRQHRASIRQFFG